MSPLQNASIFHIFFFFKHILFPVILENPLKPAEIKIFSQKIPVYLNFERRQEKVTMWYSKI